MPLKSIRFFWLTLYKVLNKFEILHFPCGEILEVMCLQMKANLNVGRELQGPKVMNLVIRNVINVLQFNLVFNYNM